MTYCHPLCAMPIGPLILRHSHFKIWPWKPMVKVMCKIKVQGQIWPSNFKGQGHGQGQTHWSHLRHWVQSICLLYVSWQSDHFWLRCSKFYIWPWKFKVKVMVEVKPDGHIWDLEFNWYVCFLSRSNWTIFGWDIANSILTLKIHGQGQGHNDIPPKSNQVMYRSEPTIVPKMKEIQNVVRKFIAWEQESTTGGGGPTRWILLLSLCKKITR